MTLTLCKPVRDAEEVLLSVGSNTPPNYPNFDTDEGNEPLIDTIRVSGPISGHAVRRLRYYREVEQDGTFLDYNESGYHLLDGGRLFLTSRAGQPWACIESSLPTMHFTHNVTAIGLTEGKRMVSTLFDQAREVVHWEDEDYESLTVQAIHLVRDFHSVPSPDFLLTGLQRLSVPRASNPILWNDSHHGGALTLVREVRDAWRVSLYDKATEVLSRAVKERDPDRREWLHSLAEQAEGQLRYEAQLKRPVLRRADLNLVRDLTLSPLLDRREYFFRHVRLGEPVGGLPRLVEVMTDLARSGDKDYKHFGSVTATLMAEAHGVRSPYSHNTTVRDRDLAARWNLSAADTVQLPGQSVRLDYTSGTLVSAA